MSEQETKKRRRTEEQKLADDKADLRVRAEKLAHRTLMRHDEVYRARDAIIDAARVLSARGVCGPELADAALALEAEQAKALNMEASKP